MSLLLIPGAPAGSAKARLDGNQVFKQFANIFALTPGGRCSRRGRLWGLPPRRLRSLLSRVLRFFLDSWLRARHVGMSAPVIRRNSTARWRNSQGANCTRLQGSAVGKSRSLTAIPTKRGWVRDDTDRGVAPGLDENEPRSVVIPNPAGFWTVVRDLLFPFPLNPAARPYKLPLPKIGDRVSHIPVVPPGEVL